MWTEQLDESKAAQGEASRESEEDGSIFWQGKEIAQEEDITQLLVTVKLTINMKDKVQKPAFSAGLACMDDDCNGDDDDDVFVASGTFHSSIVSVQQKKNLSLNIVNPFIPTTALQPCSGSPGGTNELTLLEKLIRTHPIWYLPDMGRVAAIHLLRDQNSGVFIVRQASKPGTMALSIRLPCHSEQETDHYLLETTVAGIHVEGSPNYFAALPLLLAHYCEHWDELRVQLSLPLVIKQCVTRKELISYALLGQEFWSVANSRSLETSFHMPQRLPYSLSHSTFSQSHNADAVVHSSDRFPRSVERSSQQRSMSISSSCPSSQAATPTETAPHNDGPGKRSIPKSRSAHETAHLVNSSPRERQRSFRMCNWLFSSAGEGKSSTEHRKSTSAHNTPIVSRKMLPPAHYEESNVVGDYFTNKENCCSVTTLLQNSDEYVCDTPSLGRKRLETFKPNSPEPTHSETSSASTTLEKRSLKSFASTNTLSGEVTGALPTTTAIKSKPEPPRKNTSLQCNPSSVPPFKTCVEELRQRRLDSAKCNRGGFLSPRPSPPPLRTGSVRESPGNQRHEIPVPVWQARVHAAPDKPFASPVLQRQRKSEHRLSAPCLADLSASSVEQHTDFLRELRVKQKFPAVAVGEALSTINEGLPSSGGILEHTDALNGSDSSTSKGEDYAASTCNPLARKRRGSLNNATGIATGKEAMKECTKTALLPRAQKRSTSVDSRETPNKNKSVLPKPNVAQSLKPPAKVGRRNETRFHTETNGQWVAVTDEMKQRQQTSNGKSKRAFQVNGVALPQKVTYRRPPTISTASTLSDAQQRQLSTDSDYAMLSDFGDFDKWRRSDSTTKEEDAVSNAGTVFCEPWDSSVWENLLTLVDSIQEPTMPATANTNVDAELRTYTNAEQDNILMIADKFGQESVTDVNNPESYTDRCTMGFLAEFSANMPTSSDSSTVSRSTLLSRNGKPAISKEDSTSSREAFFRMDHAKTPPRLRGRANRKRDDPSWRIQDYVEGLVADPKCLFGATVMNFIKCTLEAQTTDPSVIVRNVRQFISGIKNNILLNQSDLQDIIERERSQLNATELLNIDAILEGVLIKIVLRPLKPHIYHAYMKDVSRNGSLQTLLDNLTAVRHKAPPELGIQVCERDAATLEGVRTCLRRMQDHYSPVRKLEQLLEAICLAHYNVPDVKLATSKQLPAADQLVSWMLYILSRCGVVGCEIECNYIWSLLHPALLYGEASYYLTALASAIHVLKHVDLLPKLLLQCDSKNMSLSGDLDVAEGFVRVAVPDTQGGRIRYQSFPSLPGMTAGKLAKMIAHKFGITNPEDHGLYLLVNGFENCLLPSQSPDVLMKQLHAAGKQHLFAYKRYDAKIAWPKSACDQMSPKLC